MVVAPLVVDFATVLPGIHGARGVALRDRFTRDLAGFIVILGGVALGNGFARAAA